MKCFYYLFTLLILTSSCSHRIARKGYKIRRSDHIINNVPIQRGICPPDSIAIKVGEIKLGETGFSMWCNEQDALKILQGEAGALEADLIVVTQENRPDLWSSCYRCRASFYKYISDEVLTPLESHENYAPKELNKRLKKDRTWNTILIGSAIIGPLFLLNLRPSQ